MRIAEVQVFKFEELTGKARERALEDARHHLSETFDPDPMTDYFKEELAAEGLPTDKVYWSLSYTQGDGVGFYGRVDAEKFVAFHKLKKKIPAPLKSGITFYTAFSFHIEGEHGRYHGPNTGRVRFDEDDYGTDCPDRWLTIARWLRGVIQDRYASMSHYLEGKGYEEMDYQSSEPYIIEFINANDFEYEESGKAF